MEKKEIRKILMKIEIIMDWYGVMSNGEDRVNIDNARELLEALWEVK